MGRITVERTSTSRASGGLVQRGGGAISAITIDGGTAATGATVAINDSTDGSGTDIWSMRAMQYDSKTVTFVKSIPFSNGLYVNITPSGLTANVSIAYE